MSALKSEILNRFSTARLPSLPHVLLRLMAMCQKDNTTISDLAGLIEQDPAMTHKILQVASSPAYRHLGQQNKLEQSLITLGTHLVRMVVINESVFQNFNNLPAFQHQDLHFFWLHSLKTAIIARKAAWYMGLSNIDEAYLAGLMHDIGRLALLAVVPDLYQDLFTLPDTSGLCEKEYETLGIDHAEAGAALIRQWDFGTAFAESVAHHHSTLAPQALPDNLARLIHMSNRLAECAPDDPAIETIARHYQFPIPITIQIVAETHRDADESAAYLGLDISDLGTLQEGVVQQPPPFPVQQQINLELSSLIQASELGRFFLGHKTETDLQDAALKAASALFSLNSTVLLWQEGTPGQYKVIAINKTVEQLKGHPVAAVSPGWIAESFTHMLPAFIPGLDDLSLTPEKNMARLLGGTSWLLLPLAGNGECPGLIFASVSPTQLEALREDKYRLIYFGRQFISAWNHLLDVKKTIDNKVALAEEKHRRISQEMAHEVNTPLAVIRNYLFVLNKQVDEHSQEKKVISILNEEVVRLGKLINEMSDPAYSKKAQSGRTDIKALVQDVIALFHETRFIPDNLQIITHASSALPEKMLVRSPENLLRQVLVNLIKNAVEAMPGDGSIMITHKGLVEQENTTYYALSIRDTGPGIPETILKNGFQPTTITTITEGKDHQGLGLRSVYSLINQIEAQIDCQSGAGGTVFNLLIPAHTAEEVGP
ncbi:MAG: HDOD domain-containing protein [Oxalobacter sp.]|nr:HDOD domain-containing protein [Oxalobacter sp.]